MKMNRCKNLIKINKNSNIFNDNNNNPYLKMNIYIKRIEVEKLKVTLSLTNFLKFILEIGKTKVQYLI